MSAPERGRKRYTSNNDSDHVRAANGGGRGTTSSSISKRDPLGTIRENDRRSSNSSASEVLMPLRKPPEKKWGLVRDLAEQKQSKLIKQAVENYWSLQSSEDSQVEVVSGSEYYDSDEETGVKTGYDWPRDRKRLKVFFRARNLQQRGSDASDYW